MENLSVLIKPVSGRCNLNCKYCFYADETSMREIPDRGIMSEVVSGALIKKALNEAEKSVAFAFQGGEPMLAGLDFYKRFCAYVNENNIKNLKIVYSLQTNGTLIDERWCQFFKEYSFLIGISIDGYEKVHDFLRKNESIGSYLSSIKAAALLKKYAVEFNVLTVINKYTAAHPLKTYNSLKSCGFRYLQFIPCLPPLNGGTDYSPTGAQYAKFLVFVYRLWLEDYNRGNYISIRLFDNIIAKLQGKGAELCSFTGHCSIQFVIEADGTVYPCDFYCLDGYELGNVLECNFEQISHCKNAVDFVKSSLTVDNDCKDCNYFYLCSGGCRREKNKGMNMFCESYKALFEQVCKSLDEV